MGLKKELLEHKAFWGVLAIFVILPILSLITNDNGDNINGSAIQNIAYMKSGDKLHLEVDDYGVKTITLTILEDVKNSKLRHEELDETSWDFTGKVHSRFRIFSDDADKFGNLEFRLKISEVDLYKVNLNRDEVKLFLEGNELDTKLVDIKDDFVYYDVTAEKMGEFLIGKAIVEEVVEEEAVAQPSEVIEKPIEVVEPEVQEPIVSPVTGKAIQDDGDEEGGFFAWVKSLFN